MMHIGHDSTGYQLLHVNEAIISPNQSNTISLSSFGSVSLDHDSLIDDGSQTAYVKFFVWSRSNVDWQSIDWRPYIYSSLDTIYPVVDYGMYTRLLKYSDGKDITSSTYQNATSIEVTPDWNLFGGILFPDGKEGYMVVKADDQFLGSMHLKSYTWGFQKTPSKITFSGADLLGTSWMRVEFYTADSALAGLFNLKAEYDLDVDGTTENNVYHTSVYQRVPDGLTGHNY